MTDGPYAPEPMDEEDGIYWRITGGPLNGLEPEFAAEQQAQAYADRRNRDWYADYDPKEERAGI